MHEPRQTGRTTKQMINAPKGAVFVWLTANLSYPQALAEKVDRTDLEIVPRSWILSDKWRGQILTGIVVDHAIRLHTPEYEILPVIKSRIR